jgi:hypothetical protein
MRHAYGNANGEPYSHTYGDINANSNAYGYGGGFRYTYSYSYNYRHTVTHADVHTWGHTRAVGYCRAGASRSLSFRWMHRWNKYLRVWWR